MKHQVFSIGFMFDDIMERVVLIFKRHGPKLVRGRWNGVGGHKEEGESPAHCMAREFGEETGVATMCRDWERFVITKGKDFTLHVFYACNTKALEAVRSITEGDVAIFLVEDIGDLRDRLCPCVEWWIPFLCDATTENRLETVTAQYSKEDDAAPTISTKD